MKLPPAKLALKRAALVLFAALAALLCAELALRLLAPRYYPVIIGSYEYDHELGFRLRPGAHLFKTTDHQQESVTNQLGTANFQESFDGYETLVFAVGDSFTQGTGLPADMAYPAQLDLMLNRDAEGFYAKKVGVVNLGVAGFGGEQELISLRRWAERLRPPAAILYLGCDNDFTDDLAFKSGDRRRLELPGSPVWGRMATPMRLFQEHSQIGLRVRNYLLERRLIRLSDAALGKAGRTVPVAELQAPMLERLAFYARERGALLVVSWSDPTDSYGWMKAWAERNGIAFADWVPRAESVRAAMPRLPLGNQHTAGHHRGWANHLIAEEFLRQMRARGLYRVSD
jgi:lysophospholipase L1-like esterase